MKRRCFRFSLRTLFVVVTVFGACLAYELNWIRQRHEGLRWFDAHGVGGAIGFVREPRPPLLWHRRLFSEAPIEVRCIAPLDCELADEKAFRAQVAKMASLFPECQIVDVSAFGPWPPWPSEAELKEREQREFEAASERYNARRDKLMVTSAQPCD